MSTLIKSPYFPIVAFGSTTALTLGWLTYMYRKYGHLTSSIALTVIISLNAGIFAVSYSDFINAIGDLSKSE